MDINNNNSPPSPYTPYITKENEIYQIIPQKAINIAFIQNNILAYNNKTINYNNNYYKINNTHSNFYLEHEHEREREREKDNIRANKDMKPRYRRDISPQSEYYLQNNNDNNMYNKTVNAFYMHSNKSMNKNSKTNNNSINKFDKNYFSNSNNSHNKRKKRSTRTIVVQDNDNNDNPNIYKDYNDSNDYFCNNYNEKKKMRKEFTDLDINNRTKYPNDIMKDKLVKKMKNRVFTKEIYSNNNINENKTFMNSNRKYLINSITSPKYSENRLTDESDINNVLCKKRQVINEYRKKYQTSNLNTSYDICQNVTINYGNKDNKIIFDNEESIIEYVNKKYEIEKKRRYFGGKVKFTGYVLTKKLKGKTLYDIRIGDDDINLINQKLIDEQIEINNQIIQIHYLNQDNEKIIKSLEQQILKYKEENESLSSKNKMNTELIKQLDSEKQNFSSISGEI